MIIEGLIIKGIYGMVHWGVTHATSTFVAHLAHAATHMTIQQIATTVAITGLATGGIIWTAERIGNIKKAITAIDRGNYKNAVIEFGKFLISTNLDIKLLPDAINDNLDKLNLSNHNVRVATEFIKNNELSIASYLRNNK